MNKSADIGVVLVSGGMDSLVCAAIANEKHQQLAFLHLNYGQNTEDKELSCFKNLAEFYHVAPRYQKIIDIQFLKQIGGSSLTDDDIQVSEYDKTASEMPSSYVPFRNTHILSMAVSWSEVIGATKIYIGAVEEDSSGYPDCRKSYYQAFNELIKQGTQKGDIQIITPVIDLQKTDIIHKAYELKAPLEKSWSCYESSDLACGVCDSCALRLRAFQKCKLEDPIAYKTRPSYL